MDNSKTISVITEYQTSFHPVVRFDSAKDNLLAIDLSQTNAEIPTEILTDTRSFAHYINEKLKSAKAKYGMGGYNELRAVYSNSKVFDAEKPGDEPRRLHLGTDIWGKPHTAVMAPLPGIIHSFANNDRFGDYGGTIILAHILDKCSFYTLYGHLSLNSIKNLREGARIMAGDIFADFGIPSENGHWPPHLHFQIILDLGKWKGDYPGVCRVSEKEKYLLNSPDPDLILQLNKYL